MRTFKFYSLSKFQLYIEILVLSDTDHAEGFLILCNSVWEHSWHSDPKVPGICVLCTMCTMHNCIYPVLCVTCLHDEKHLTPLKRQKHPH